MRWGAAEGERFNVVMRMAFIARALALLWAGFWICFFVAESWAWRSPWRVMAFWAGVGLAFSILALGIGSLTMAAIREHAHF